MTDTNITINYITTCSTKISLECKYETCTDELLRLQNTNKIFKFDFSPVILCKQMQRTNLGSC